jgi:hypothetical protein
MLKAIALIICFSIVLNWSISLSLVSFNSQDKKVRLKSAILSLLSGIVLGCIIYVL